MSNEEVQGGFGSVPNEEVTSVETPQVQEDNGVIVAGNDNPPVSKESLQHDPEKDRKIKSIIPSSDDITEDIDHTKHAKLVMEEDDLPYEFDPNKKLDDVVNDEISLPMPTDDPATIRDLLTERPNIDPTLTEKGNMLVQVLQEGDKLIPGHQILREAVHDESREFTNYILSDNQRKLRAVNPTVNPPTGNGKKLTGEAAVLRMQSMLGLGGVINIPLWHSGFWVTIKTPSDLQLLDLHEQTLAGKIEVGRNLFGLGFSNDIVYMMEPIMDLFNNCIYSTTLKTGVTDFWNKVKVHDFQTICWGLASAIWPNGFNYTRTILDSKTPDGSNDRVVTAKLNLRKLLWVDNQSLNDYQRKHMSERFGKNMSDESLEMYQKHFTRPMTKRIHLTGIMYADLHVPSVEENITNGSRWVTDIKQMLESTLITNETSNEKRTTLLRDYSRATLMCQYSHWVKSIVFVSEDGEEEVHEDKDTIYLALKRFSSVEEARENFITGVIKFISETSVSIVGIPTVKEDEENRLEQFPHLLPLDAMMLFFSLLVQRVSRITQ